MNLITLALLPTAIAQQTPKTATPAAAKSPAPQQLPAVQQMLSRGQLKEAEAQLNALAQQHPEPAGTERLLGTIHYQRNEFAAADAAFERAIAQDPDDLQAVQMRGTTLYRMGKGAEAIPFLERSNSAIGAANSDSTYVLALCYMDVRRYDDARRIFAKQYKLTANSAGAYLFLARMLLRRNYPVEAAQMAQKALVLDPRLPLAHFLLGQIALAKSEQNEAITQFEAERKINPMDGEVYERLGDSYMHASRLEEAQQALDCAVLLEPNATGPYILLGQVLLKREDAATALNYLVRAEKMDPGNHLTHLLLGQAYRAAGRKDDATREYKTAEAIQSSPGDHD
ncbi:tetratricopeptide repeat protein [Granulicella aggregans]|uniref:tetratricopeptide repeat protein n=1 Tax=Granulicella aggregans TaxID=474949 RepID=UPI0021DFAC60|nr:tetratricopeptide repeat protein [Granulicella aggregans]